jgi:hypothetical protein
MEFGGHVAHMEQSRNRHKILVRKENVILESDVQMEGKC